VRIVYLHQYFTTPEEGGATRSYHIASKLVEEGNSVDLITSHDKPGYYIKRINGIRVHYLPIGYDNRYGKLKRIWAFLTFAYQSLRIALRLKPDLCYATSTPLTIGWIALRLNSKIGTPFIFEVRDLWPEAPKQLGIIKTGVLLFLAKRLEKKMYYRADKIEMISNFSNCKLSREVLSREEVLPQVPSENKLTVCYSGALGFVNNMPLLEFVIHTIGSLEDVELFISGTGKYQEKINKVCEKYKNCKYVGHLDKRTNYQLLTFADVSLTTFLDYPVLETNSPNKFFDGLACGTVCLINNGGWTQELVEENNCGFHFSQENLKSILLLLSNDLELLNTYKQEARKLSLSFDKDLLCDRISQLIKDNFKPKSISSSRVYNQTE